MEKQLIPNATQIPNILLDFVLPELPPGEMRCMLYICRRTYGFHKEQDRISFSQFSDGLPGKDKGSGVSRSVVAESLKNLAAAGAIFVRRYKNGNVYRINLNMDVAEVVRKVNHLRKNHWFENHTKSSPESEPKVVRIPDTQNIGNIGNKEEIKKNNETDGNRKGQLFGIYKALKAKGMIRKLNPEYEALLVSEKNDEGEI